MSGNKTLILDWDSDFFSMKIASIFMEKWDKEFLDSCLQQYQRDKYNLLYLFLKEGILLPKDYLCHYTCNLVDKKRTYIFKKNAKGALSPYVSLYSGPPSVLYDLAIQSGISSRYNVDPDFSKTDFENLYKVWVNNSINGQMADYVLVYTVQQQIAGFLTLKKKETCMSIGLIASDYAYRRLGIGTALIETAKHYAYIDNKPIEVVTQADNIPACSFYEKNGFEIKSQSTVYHIWLDKKVI